MLAITSINIGGGTATNVPTNLTTIEATPTGKMLILARVATEITIHVCNYNCDKSTANVSGETKEFHEARNT